MRTELNIQSMPVERGRIAATLTAESSAESIAVAQASAEVMCRFVGTAVAPYFIIPDTEHMQQALDVAQVNLPEFRIHFNRFLTARDPADAADALAYLLDNMSFADSAQALIIRPYNWVMMNMLKHAENLQESIAGLYPDLAAKNQGRILGQKAFDLTTSLQGMTDEEYNALPTSPQVSDLIGKTRRKGKSSPVISPLERSFSNVVLLSLEGQRGIVLVPRRAGGAFIMEADIPPKFINAVKKGKTRDNELQDESLQDVTIHIVRTLRFGLFYRSGSVHYVSPLKELLLIRILIHMYKLFEGERPFGSNYRYYEPPVQMMAKLQSVFLRIAADTLITATGDLSDYLGSEDGRVLLEGANLAYGYESMPLFLALLACSNSVKTIEQMLLLSQQIKGSVTDISDTVPPVSLEPRFVRWVAESLLNPVLEFRNETLQKAGITDVPAFVADPSFVTGAPDVNGITEDSNGRYGHTIFGLDRLQLASVTELIRLEIADMISAERTFIDCMRGGYARVAHVRYNGRYRDLDHMLKLVETHASILTHIVPNAEDVRAAATLPYRQISFYGPYSAYEMGRTVLPVQYGVYDLAARLTKQMGKFAEVPADDDGSLVNVFSYIQSSIFRYEPRYMFPFFVQDHKAVVKRIDLEGTAGHVYAINEGGEADEVLSILPEAYRSTKLWANNAPFSQQYREVGLVSPCWDLDTFELLSNLVDLPTDRTYFPAVKPDIIGGRISMMVDYKKLDPALQKMLDLEFETPPLGASRKVDIDRVPALASIGVIMPYVPRLAHDLKASWMDDFAMVDITGGIYGTAGTIVLPRDGSYARAAASVDEIDRWRAPSLAEGFQYKSRSAAYGSVPLTFEAE